MFSECHCRKPFGLSLCQVQLLACGWGGGIAIVCNCTLPGTRKALAPPPAGVPAGAGVALCDGEMNMAVHAPLVPGRAADAWS